MNIMLIFGLLFSVGCIYYGVPSLEDTWQTYIDPHSFILVFGGTIGATMISTRVKDFVAILKVLSGWMYLRRKSVSNLNAVNKLVEISETASRTGKPSVLDLGKGFDDGYLDRALSLMGTGLEEEFVRRSLEIDILEEKRRHAKLIGMIRNMGTFAPMFGMMGTVMGVVLVLQNVTDIESVVSGMSLALLTTLYGLILSSLVFTPITNKLKFINDQDALTKEIMMEGVIMIMNGEIPLKVEKMLRAYLSSHSKKQGKA
ncbi:hypothetical protein HOH87_06145 [bacterium]|jgi:chemotaxis protein MotA|nr:hypothetical protein [bacterium]